MSDPKALVIHRNRDFGDLLADEIRDVGGKACVVSGCPRPKPREGLAAKMNLSGDEAEECEREIDRVILDVHAPYGGSIYLRHNPGLDFFADLRACGYALPVVLLAWPRSEDLRLTRLAACPYLFCRYRDLQDHAERGSFAFRRLPVSPRTVVQVMNSLRPMTKEEWKEVRQLKATLPTFHPREAEAAS